LGMNPMPNGPIQPQLSRQPSVRRCELEAENAEKGCRHSSAIRVPASRTLFKSFTTVYGQNFGSFSPQNDKVVSFATMSVHNIRWSISRLRMTVPQFEVALSFAGADRERAEELAQALRKLGVDVFYDADRSCGGKIFICFLQTSIRIPVFA
jgi:hypothetical protein